VAPEAQARDLELELRVVEMAPVGQNRAAGIGELTDLR